MIKTSGILSELLKRVPSFNVTGQKKSDGMVDELWEEEDQFLRDLKRPDVWDELPNLVVREEIKETIEKNKENVTSILKSYTPEDLDTSVEDYQRSVLQAIGTGMYLSTLMSVLALVPSGYPAPEPPASNNKQTGNVDGIMNKVWAQGDRLIERIKENKDKLSDPVWRERTASQMERRKGQIKKILNSYIKEDIPKTVDEFVDLQAGRIFNGMEIGAFKTTLAIVPAKGS